jgi:hypothetical protein
LSLKNEKVEDIKEFIRKNIGFEDGKKSRTVTFLIDNKVTIHALSKEFNDYLQSVG